MIYQTLSTVGDVCQSVDVIYQLLLTEFTQATTKSERFCGDVSQRLSQEVGRICAESQRIQDSGEVNTWAVTLARHRLDQ